MSYIGGPPWYVVKQFRRDTLEFVRQWQLPLADTYHVWGNVNTPRWQPDAPTRGYGIQYDPLTATIWVVTQPNVYQYTLEGELLHSVPCVPDQVRYHQHTRTYVAVGDTALWITLHGDYALSQIPALGAAMVVELDGSRHTAIYPAIGAVEGFVPGTHPAHTNGRFLQMMCWRTSLIPLRQTSTVWQYNARGAHELISTNPLWTYYEARGAEFTGFHIAGRFHYYRVYSAKNPPSEARALVEHRSIPAIDAAYSDNGYRNITTECDGAPLLNARPIWEVFDGTLHKHYRAGTTETAEEQLHCYDLATGVKHAVLTNSRWTNITDFTCSPDYIYATSFTAEPWQRIRQLSAPIDRRIGLQHCAWEQDGQIYYAQRRIDAAFGAATAVGTGRRPSLRIRADGSLDLAYEDATTGTLRSRRSVDLGATWS